MVATESLADTIRERLETEEVLEMPATLEEYFDVLDELEGRPYTVLFNQGILTATMSQASEPHEIIIGNLLYLFNALFRDDEAIRVMGSARIVYVPDCDRSFNPDALLVKGPTELFPRDRKMAATVNPWLLVEVLSSSTEGSDYAEKLPCYKTLKSVRYLLFVHQNQPYATLFARTAQGDAWLNNDFNGLDAAIRLDEGEVPLREVYRKIIFPEIPKKPTKKRKR